MTDRKDDSMERQCLKSWAVNKCLQSNPITTFSVSANPTCVKLSLAHINGWQCLSSKFDWVCFMNLTTD